MLEPDAHPSADALLTRALDGVFFGFYLDLAGEGSDRFASAFKRTGWRAVHAAPEAPLEIQLIRSLSARAHTAGSNEERDPANSDGDQLQLAPTENLFSLARLFEDHGSREIHWLRFRAADGHLLATWGNSPCRPWLVIATGDASSADPTWHHELANRDYSQVYLDGSVRAYVSSEHPEIAQSLKSHSGFAEQTAIGAGDESLFGLHETGVIYQAAPPASQPSLDVQAAYDIAKYPVQGYSASNYGHQTAGLKAAELKAPDRTTMELKPIELQECLQRLADERRLVEKLQASRVALSQELNRSIFDRDLQIQILQQQLAALNTEAANLRKTIDAIYKSTSWSISAPMRWAVTGPRAALHSMKGASHSLSTRVLRRPVGALLTWVMQHPELKRKGRSLVRRFPALEAKLIAIAVRGKSGGSDISMLDADPDSIKAWHSLLRG